MKLECIVSVLHNLAGLLKAQSQNEASPFYTTDNHSPIFKLYPNARTAMSLKLIRSLSFACQDLQHCLSSRFARIWVLACTGAWHSTFRRPRMEGLRRYISYLPFGLPRAHTIYLCCYNWQLVFTARLQRTRMPHMTCQKAMNLTSLNLFTVNRCTQEDRVIMLCITLLQVYAKSQLCSWILFNLSPCSHIQDFNGFCNWYWLHWNRNQHVSDYYVMPPREGTCNPRADVGNEVSTCDNWCSSWGVDLNMPTPRISCIWVASSQPPQQAFRCFQTRNLPNLLHDCATSHCCKGKARPGFLSVRLDLPHIVIAHKPVCFQVAVKVML